MWKECATVHILGLVRENFFNVFFYTARYTLRVTTQGLDNGPTLKLSQNNHRPCTPSGLSKQPFGICPQVFVLLYLSCVEVRI